MSQDIKTNQVPSQKNDLISILHKCPCCSYKFYTIERLLKHLKKAHPAVEPFISPSGIIQEPVINGGPVVLHHTLVDHQKRLPKCDKAARFQCPTCHKIFKDSWHLKRHCRTHNTAVDHTSLLGLASFFEPDCENLLEPAFFDISVVPVLDILTKPTAAVISSSTRH